MLEYKKLLCYDIVKRRKETMNMKRWLCLLLVISVVMTFGACAKESGESDVTTSGKTTTAKATTTTQAVTTTEANPFEEFMEITWLTQYGDRHVDGRWDEAELEERFNVAIEVWHNDSLNKEQMAALVAAGDIPDFFFMPASPRDPYGMYGEKLVRSVPLEAIRKYLPGQYELMEMMPIGFSYNLVPDKTDEYIGLTHIGMSGAQYFYDATCVNLDWLESIGYEVDTDTLKPVKISTEGFEWMNDNLFVGELDFTFEETNDIMRKFTEDDPDGNGEDDTYGMVYLPESNNTNMTQEGLFGFVSDWRYLYKDPNSGDIVPRFAYTPYRDYLAWISDMLTKGYMRRLPGELNWLVEWQAIAQTNKVGIMQAHRTAYMMPSNVTYVNYPPASILVNTDKESRFVIGMLLNGPEGRTNCTYDIDVYGTGVYRVDYFGGEVSDEKMARILQMLQYTTYESEDNYNKFKFGLEGTHWKWAGEPYMSTMLTTTEADLPEKFRGWPATFSLWVTYSTADKETYDGEKNGYWTFPGYAYATNLYERYACIPEKFISDIYMGQEMGKAYNELNAKLSGQINTVVNDFKNRAIKGEIANFNTEWVQYIDQVYAAGLEELVDKFYNNPEYKKYDPGDKFKLRGRP